MRVKNNKKIVVAMSPKGKPTGQAGGRRKGKRVVIAISGGIDSSVAAALLKKEGFDLVGVFMQLIDSSQFRERQRQAERIAKILKIPFVSLNLKKEFKKEVIDYFVRGYKRGMTPNPCVICNKKIKFKLIGKKTLASKADYLATGHYARKRETRDKQQGVRYKLLKGKDKRKDQSYFLWQLNQNQLSRIIFPVGEYTKNQVKSLAKKFKLPVFNIPESQEICFIQTTVDEFLRKYLKTKSGKIVEASRGKVVGQHQGLWFYTIGQRKGIGLSGGPYWVLKKDLKKNFLIVTRNEKDLYKKEIMLKNINWISGKTPKLSLKIKAKIRYRHKLSPATIYQLKSNTYHLIFDKPQRAITPGQSAVFYKGDEVLGGGIIC